MPRLEFGQLYKFVVSLGFVLMAAAFVGPWAILRDQGALLISETELEGLTPQARAVLEAKQGHAQRIVEWYPWAALVLFVLGAVVSAWGLWRWWDRQKVADERENVGLAAEKRQLEPLTPEETERRLDEEAAAAAEEPTEDRRSSAMADRPAPEPAVPSSEEGVRVADDRATIRDYLRRRYAEVESLATSRLEEAFGGERGVHADVKITGEGSRELGRADVVALAAAGSPEPSLIFDIKLTTPKNAANQTEAALVNAARFAVALHRRAAAIALLVVNDEEDRRRTELGVALAMERLSGVLTSPAGAVVLTPDDLRSLPTPELRARILGSIRSPGRPSGPDFTVSA